MDPIVIILSSVSVILIIIAVYYIFFSGILSSGKKIEKIEGFSDGIKVMSACSMPPVIIRRGKCRYPMAARIANIEATVIIDIHINEEGHIIESQIPFKIGYELEEAALEYIKKWTFDPAILNRKFIDVWIRIPISFKLQKKKSPA